MPFRLRLGKRSQQYNVSNKDLFVIPIDTLTNETIECTLFSTSVGRECLSNVCQRLNIQSDHLFGLLFKSKRGFHQWVDISKPLKKQLDKYAIESRLYLRLQYFVPNYHFLTDEVSRYHYFCSMKLLVIEGRLVCNRDEAILLASFSLQAEFGDFNPERHDIQYLKNFALFPPSMVTNNRVAQDLLLESVINAYRKLQGVPTSLAEIYYISEAQQLDGIALEGFPVNDSGLDVCLGVTLRGIFVVDINGSKEIFSWNCIKNLVHQKKVFTIERNPDGLRKNYTTFDSDFASCLWRTCVEQHQYFMKGLRNSVDTDSQQSDQSKQDLVSSINVNTNGTNSLNRISCNTDISVNTDISNATVLPQTLYIADQTFSESINNINTSVDSFDTNTQYKTNSYRDLTSTAVTPQIHSSSETNIFGAHSSADATDLHQIHVSFSDSSEHAMNNQSVVSSNSNITTVQVHHHPSWTDLSHQQLNNVTELTYEQRRQLLPPYISPPDYQTFMSHKYANLNMTVGQRSSHPMTNYGTNGYIIPSTSTSTSSIKHMIGQHGTTQYSNFNDLSNLELDQIVNNNKCAVRSSLPPTNYFPSQQPLIASPSRLHQLASGVITCSTPELNSLSILNNDKVIDNKSIQHNNQLLYFINNQKLPPPYSFNSVPDLSIQPMVASQLIHNIIEPSVTVSQNQNRRQVTAGSEPNISNIPLMTAYSTNVKHVTHINSSTNVMHSSVDKLLQSQGLQQQQQHNNNISPNVSQPSNNHIKQLSNLQNIYTLSQRQQHSVISNNHNNTHNNNNNQITPVSGETVTPRVMSQPMPSNISKNKLENRNSSSSDITSTIGSYLVKKNETKVETNNDIHKDRRVFALEEMMNDPDFIREFDLLPRMNPTAKFTTALLPDNMYRNRFRDILPYEDNRVKIMSTKENKSGYINASHVTMNLGNTRNHYIASQGPLAATAIDYWQMVWEYSVNLIVMVTNFHELNQQKCFEYLPLTHESPHNVLRFGDYEITCNSTSMSMTYITSLLSITLNGQKRTVTHLRFTEWNDHSCPDDVPGFLAFLSEMDAIHRRSTREGSGFGRKRSQPIPPIVVHCSAGVGRSGVVILCDCLLKFLDYNSTDMLDVPKALIQLRFQRMLSVQHCIQFRFVCKVLTQYLANSRLI